MIFKILTRGRTSAKVHLNDGRWDESIWKIIFLSSNGQLKILKIRTKAWRHNYLFPEEEAKKNIGSGPSYHGRLGHSRNRTAPFIAPPPSLRTSLFAAVSSGAVQFWLGSVSPRLPNCPWKDSQSQPAITIQYHCAFLALNSMGWCKEWCPDSRGGAMRRADDLRACILPEVHVHTQDPFNPPLESYMVSSTLLWSASFPRLLSKFSWN